MSFQAMLAASPLEMRQEITEMDAFMKSLRPLKFKRTVDKRKMNYVSSDYGISFAIFPTGDHPHAAFGWYFLHDKVTGAWYRKTDYFVETLAEIKKEDPAMTLRIFDGIHFCTSCKGNPCSAISYVYEGKIKPACYGRIHLPLQAQGFADARAFFGCLNALVTE